MLVPSSRCHFLHKDTIQWESITQGDEDDLPTHLPQISLSMYFSRCLLNRILAILCLKLATSFVADGSQQSLDHVPSLRQSVSISQPITSSKLVPHALTLGASGIGLHGKLLQKRTSAPEPQALTEAREIVRINFGAVPPHPLSDANNNRTNRQRWIPEMIEWRRLFGRDSAYYRAPDRPPYAAPSWAQWHVFNLHLRDMQQEGGLSLRSRHTLLRHYQALEQHLMDRPGAFECPVCYRATSCRQGVRKSCGMELCKACQAEVWGDLLWLLDVLGADRLQCTSRGIRCPNCRRPSCRPGAPLLGAGRHPRIVT